MYKHSTEDTRYTRTVSSMSPLLVSVKDEYLSIPPYLKFSCYSEIYVSACDHPQYFLFVIYTSLVLST